MFRQRLWTVLGSCSDIERPFRLQPRAELNTERLQKMQLSQFSLAGELDSMKQRELNTSARLETLAEKEQFLNIDMRRKCR